MKCNLINLILAFILLSSCNGNTDYIKYNSINSSWHIDSLQTFNFQIKRQKVSTFNSFIKLRVNDKYTFNNIFLIVKLADSEKIISVDTLEYKLADKYGNFLGSKMIDLNEISLQHKEKIKFENNVNYTVTIEHAMRYLNKIGGIEKLNGIMDIGYKVELVE